jgi:probable F420-dependent oxidoreductase
MNIGIALPHIGPGAGREAIVEVARQAEALGFDSVWVLDRLLWPLSPTAKYPGNPRGELPEVMQIVYEPMTVLSFAAAHTEKVRLGTSVLVAAYRSPVLVAKMAATLDLLSRGRLILGVGSGWSTDEFAAANQSIEERDERTDEFICALRELWRSGDSRFEGKYYRVPPSIFLPKPFQQCGPDIWIGGNSRRALRRAAELGDGWHPTSRFSPSDLAREMKELGRLAEKSGRNPERIELSLRWNNLPSFGERAAIEQTAERLRDYQNAGVTHVCFDLNIPQPRSQTELFEMMSCIRHEIAPQ